MAPKKDSTPPKKKDKYRTRNWKEYNRSLVNRGSITFWFAPEALQNWYSTKTSGKRGRSNLYSDDAIRCALVMKAVFHQALRQTQGLVQSLLELLGLSLQSPDYSRLCRRAKKLEIPIRRLLRHLKDGERLNVVFDSTGLKVFGEGEWKVRQHGYSKRRTWRKVHVGMCVDTGQVVVSALTTNNVSDDWAMIRMMEGLEEIPLGDVLGDGAYDKTNCREAIYDLGGKEIIPPQKTARRQKKNRLPGLEERDRVIERIRELGEEGRARWKREAGYHRRSRVETWMFRYKSTFGPRLSARTWENQVTEMRIKIDVLNRMTEMGMPASYKLAS